MSSLPSIIAIAFRSLFRNKVRTLLTLFAVFIGIFLMVFGIGFDRGFDQNIIDGSINSNAGYVILQNQHYIKSPEVANFITDATKRSEKIKTISGVKDVQPLIFSNSTIQSSYNTLAVKIKGIDPVTDKRLASIESKNLVKGTYFADGSNTPSIVIGYRMAKRLQVDVGNKVVIMLNAANGVLNQNLFKIVGIINTNNRVMDSSEILMALPQATKLLNMPLDSVSRMGVLIDNRDLLIPVYKAVAAQNTDIGVYTWDKVLIGISSFVQVDYVIQNTIIFFFGLVILGLIYNTIAMSITERRMEYLMMIAIGTPLWFIRLQIFVEVLFLLFVGTFFGLLFAWLTVMWINNTGGVNAASLIHNFSVNGASISPYIKWVVSHESYALIALLLGLGTLLLTIIPIIRATHVKLDQRN